MHDDADSIRWFLDGGLNTLHKIANVPLLHYAIASNSLKCATTLLKQGADVNYNEPNVGTPAMIVCSTRSANRLAGLRLLIKYKADLNLIVEDRNCLLSAILRENISALDILISNEVNLHQLHAPFNYHVLHAASILNFLKSAIYLLNHSTSCDIQTESGQTPLMLACHKNHKSMVQFLLWYGADKTIINNQLRTALNLTTNPEIRALLELDKKPPLPDEARTIMIDVARNNKNVFKQLCNRELGKK